MSDPIQVLTTLHAYHESQRKNAELTRLTAENARLREALTKIYTHWVTPVPIPSPDITKMRMWMVGYEDLREIARAALETPNDP